MLHINLMNINKAIPLICMAAVVQVGYIIGFSSLHVVYTHLNPQVFPLTIGSSCNPIYKAKRKSPPAIVITQVIHLM